MEQWKASDAIRKWEGIPSSTNPAVKYDVLMYPDGTFSCNCPRWTNKRKNANRTCPHIIMVERTLKLGEVDAIIEENAGKPIMERRIVKVKF